jgi:hypothetical protein
VSRIEPSHHDSATVYVTFDNHRNGDFTPYVFVSNDFGKTFRSIAAGLPSGGVNFVHVIREDPVNRDLLFVGTDIGVWMSLDRGKSWQKFMTGLPTVPVHDLKIHPRDRELIAGTHGRSIWIVDIAPLQQPALVAQGTTLFKPKVAFQFSEAPTSAPMGGGGGMGHMMWQGYNPQYGAEFVYRVAGGAPDSAPATGGGRGPAQARVVITDASGDTLRTLSGPARPGLHRIYWNFLGKQPPAQPLSPAGKRDSAQLIARMNVVFDSLAKAGRDTAMLRRLRTQFMSGDLGFGGGGGGGFGGGVGQLLASGFPPSWQDRPGEGPVVGGGPGGGGGGGGGGAGAAAAALGVDPQVLVEIAGLLRPGQTGGGFGAINQILQTLTGGRGPAQLVPSGDYLVSLTVGGKTTKQVLRVESVGNAENRAVMMEQESR